MKIVSAAEKSCQIATEQVPSAAVQPSAPNWDALAVSIASQANAISWGSTALAVIIAIAGLAWGQIITMRARREAREKAEQEVKDWIQDEGLPLVLREVDEFLRTFPRERPISDDEIAAMVAAAGADGKEGQGGKK
jgi:hypothetical protein